jgi:hypothetical protein
VVGGGLHVCKGAAIIKADLFVNANLSHPLPKERNKFVQDVLPVLRIGIVRKGVHAVKVSHERGGALNFSLWTSQDA